MRLYRSIPQHNTHTLYDKLYAVHPHVTVVVEKRIDVGTTPGALPRADHRGAGKKKKKRTRKEIAFGARKRTEPV